MPEAKVSSVGVGRPISVMVSAYPSRRFSGAIQSLAGSLDPKTRSLPVRAIVENPDGLLRAEMFATIRVTVGRAAAVLSVPAGAVANDAGETCVFVAEGDGFVRREVETGRASSSLIEIVGGLRAGERVASSGVFVLRSELKKGEMKGHEH